ncbi:hypothetical protein KSU1_C1117 [Candidatus Jettenia caeni]|uniref:Uncharacterized protein n=1 Tax=Candidatus Jettenia caeni TaxID=247490 RepID=I3ILW8_9BACT|nr:hypothetical protein KSU1_C1117 [Candidatus Jettenia caeni]
MENGNGRKYVKIAGKQTFFPPFFKGGLGGIRGEYGYTFFFLQGDNLFFHGTLFLA